MLELTGIGVDETEIGSQPQHQLDVLAQQPAQHQAHALDDRVHRDAGPLDDLLATEDPKMPDEPGAALAGRRDRLHVPAPRVALLEALREERASRQNGGQHVVEIARQRAREASHGVEALTALELRLARAERRLRLLGAGARLGFHQRPVHARRELDHLGVRHGIGRAFLDRDPRAVRVGVAEEDERHLGRTFARDGERPQRDDTRRPEPAEHHVRPPRVQRLAERRLRLDAAGSELESAPHELLGSARNPGGIVRDEQHVERTALAWGNHAAHPASDAPRAGERGSSRPRCSCPLECTHRAFQWTRSRAPARGDFAEFGPFCAT